MKIRNGFVSNSSSSSFVIMTTIGNHEKVLKDLHPYVQAVIKAMNPEKGKFCNLDIVALGELTLMDYGWLDDLDVDYDGEIPKDEYDDEMTASSAFQIYCDAVKKDEENTFTHSLGD